jgi:hypothetical protein
MNTETIGAALTIGGIRKDWIGWGLSGLVIAFLLVDSVVKVLALPFVLEAGASIGFPGASMNRGLGLLLLACTLLYIAPQTAILGAIPLTTKSPKRRITSTSAGGVPAAPISTTGSKRSETCGLA